MVMSLNFAELSRLQKYKLLTGLIVPRPIALITSLSSSGLVNAAPFSFFNVFGEDPPLIVVGLGGKLDPTGSPKDTTRNVRANGFFVVNLVDEAFAAHMSDCSIAFPAEMSEPEALHLALTAGIHSPVPRLVEAPAAIECRKLMMINFGSSRDLLVGEVLGIHVRDGIVNPETLRTNYEQYFPVGRIGGEMYARVRDHFDLKPGTFEQWQARSRERV